MCSLHYQVNFLVLVCIQQHSFNSLSYKLASFSWELQTGHSNMSGRLPADYCNSCPASFEIPKLTSLTDATLEIPSTATQQQIRDAYKKSTSRSSIGNSS